MLCGMTPGEDTLDIDFAVRGVEGRIAVTMAPNEDPEALGCDPSARGFPVCQATVETPLQGYRALLGWVQVVGTRSSDADARRFGIDPLQVFDGVETPFGFYGMHPTLFDAPSRRDRSQPLDWLAHSFLCASPSAPMERTVQPVVAFRWGFTISAGAVELARPEPLPLSSWTTHRTLLETAFPSWRFVDADRS